MTDDIRLEDVELDYASARNLSISEVVRQGVERVLGGTTSATAGIGSTGGFIPSSTHTAAPASAQSFARSVVRDVIDESVTDLALTV